MEKCYICKDKQAEIRCVIVIRGRKIVRHLCADCARKAGFTEQLKYTRRNLSSAPKITTERRDIICSGCHLEFSQFLKTGLFGCPKCYETFDRFIGDILKGIHSATYHRGRGPGKERDLDLAQLRWKLSEAVQSEDFEKAADLRDEIYQIEKGVN